MLISCIKQIRSFISLRLLCPFSSSSSSSSFFRAVLGHIQKKVFNAKTQFTDGRKTQRKTFLLNRKHPFFFSYQPIISSVLFTASASLTNYVCSFL